MTQRPSKTAELVAAARALHYRRAKDPVFVDDLAVKMCGTFWRTVVSSEILSRLVIDRMLRRLTPVLSEIVMRARYGEDYLKSAIDRGIDQYVIVGAGYETLSIRRHDLMANLTLYELDQPATQAMKHKRIRQAGITTPENAHYVAVDLNEETLRDALERTNFDFSKPAVFSWFGVTFYLELDAIRSTLTSIVSDMAPGSAVVFDYVTDQESTPVAFHKLLDDCKKFVAGHGEPWLSQFCPDSVTTMLAEIGFTEIENLGPSRVNEKYASSYPDVVLPPIFGICSAATSAN